MKPIYPNVQERHEIIHQNLITESELIPQLQKELSLLEEMQRTGDQIVLQSLNKQGELTLFFSHDAWNLLQSQLSGYLKPAKPDNESESPCSCGLEVKRGENTAVPNRPDEWLHRKPRKRNGEKSVLRIDLVGLNRFEIGVKFLGHSKRVLFFRQPYPGKTI
jgi:hypothetical protein